MVNPSALREQFAKANQGGWAIGAFNVATLEPVKAVVAAGAKRKVPVILEMSPNEAEFLGVETLAALVATYRGEKRAPLFLNLDHAQDLEIIKLALTTGFDMVHFDGSSLPPEENIARTKEVVKLAHEQGALVEGEIDAAKGGSVVHVGVPEKILTSPEQAADFVTRTGVDLLAVFFGNLHGVYRGESLDLGHLEKIKQAVKCFLTLHGGSGLSGEDLRGAVQRGIVKVNINTELRLAWSESLRQSLVQNPEEIVPYRILPSVVEDITAVVEEKLGFLCSIS